RFRVRRRCEAGGEAGSEDRDWRKIDCDAGGQGPRRGAPCFHAGGRAALRWERRRPEPAGPEPPNLDSSNALELVGFTVDPDGSAVVCLAPQLYSGFPLSADSKAHQFGSTVGPVIV